MQIRTILSLLEDLEKAVQSDGSTNTSKISTPSIVTKNIDAVDTTANQPEQAWHRAWHNPGEERKEPPGGYRGAGKIQGNAIITNPEAWDADKQPGYARARKQMDSKYAGHVLVSIPDEVRRATGYHDDKPGILDAPFRYSGDGTLVQLPNGSVLTGNWHKGVHDSKAPQDVLPIPPLDKLHGYGDKMDGVANFLVKSGHSDSDIARSLKYYFPDATDKNVSFNIHMARDVNRAGYNTGVDLTVDSPHDHSKNVLGPVEHPGARPEIDKEVHGRGVEALAALGRDRKKGANSIKSAYKSKSGADIFHSYDELDHDKFQNVNYSYGGPGEMEKVGPYTVYKIPETDDDGKPTGKFLVSGIRFGTYKKGGKKRSMSTDSHWLGTEEQWQKDKKEFLDQLANTKFYNQFD